MSNHDELMSNFFAQADALAYGKGAAELSAEGTPPTLVPHKTFTGNRPSLSVLLPSVGAYQVGQILALYEHKIAVQGFVWGINSFDQARQLPNRHHRSRLRLSCTDSAPPHPPTPPHLLQWGVELGKVLASRVRRTLSAVRKDARPIGAALGSFNYSTGRMLGAYLQAIAAQREGSITYSDGACGVKKKGDSPGGKKGGPSESALRLLPSRVLTRSPHPHPPVAHFSAAAVFKSPFDGFCTSGGECEVVASDFSRGNE